MQQILDAGGVYRILLDNFDYETTKKAVAMIGNQSLTESSGNINEKTIRHYAECGVNYISSGALTHSVYNMDLSLKQYNVRSEEIENKLNKIPLVRQLVSLYQKP